ncbi:YaaL family protein [Bacillus marinisedimentorum]|uniref:YaaL family protein n=1 Tax=Bacillus marinisedimentorum TaxID=1821260 RepID=UPI0007E23B03|nr:YaaL family protein [Bacillus marinisedimentorum]
MIFRRKGKLRKEYDQQLLELASSLKEEWMKQKTLVERSVDPSEQVLHSLRIAESKYFYILKEVKVRRISMGKLKR